jgi:hypothetical protein
VKKQINPSIKAHLLWTALILFSLLAICAIPFALGQSRNRGTAKPSVTNPARQPIPAAKIYPLQNTLPFPSAAIAHQLSYQGHSTSYSDVPFLKPQTASVPEHPAVCALGGMLGTAPQGGGTGTLTTRILRPGTPTSTCAGVIPPMPFNIETGPFIYNVHYVTNTSGIPLCTTVILHVVTEGSAVTNVQCSAFMAPFAAGDITNPARYLGDAGVSTGNPPLDTIFQLTIPPSTTIAFVVLNVNVSPAGESTVYQLILDQDILCQQATPTPTATATPSPTPAGTPSPTASPTPGACTSYEAESGTLTGSAVVLNCPTCSGSPPAKVGYVGNNSGTLEFNHVSANTTGSYTMTICYLNGDNVRYALLSVNGSQGTPVSFPSTGSFHTVGSIQRTVTLNAGSTNTLEFYNPIIGNWAPDFDRIRFNCQNCAVPTPTPAPTATPTATPTPTTTPPVAFFMGEIPLGNGVYYLQFPNGTPFGFYSYLTDSRWIYHFDMGFEYWFDANDGHSGIYFYDFASNHFFYTSPSFPFPYLYDFSLNTVLYYFPDPNRPGHYTTNPRYFYNFATGQIITL